MTYGKQHAQYQNSRRSSGAFKPTAEQDLAISLAETGRDVKISARAGAGKTSTLDLIAQALYNQRGFYVAFNKSIADEAEKRFPRSVTSRTAHSLAYRAVGYHFRDKLNERLTGRMVSERYGIVSSYGLTSINMGYLLLEMMANYMNSAEKNIAQRHAPTKSILRHLKGDLRTPEIAKKIARTLLPFANNLWDEMADSRNPMPVTHDTYLKLWALEDPEIPADFILFDEAQDASPIMLDVVSRQNAQKIWVGDGFQELYAWRMAVNAMESINTDQSCELSQSFRFGQPIADAAIRVLRVTRGANVEIRGFEKVSSMIAPVENPDAVLCRTNAGLVSEVARRMREGARGLYVEGGVSMLLKLIDGAERLQSGQPAGVQELMAFETWEEVEEYVDSGFGGDLASLVTLLEKNTPSELRSILGSVDKRRGGAGQITFSTVHKAKGLEWDTVQLGDDFRLHTDQNFTHEEANLLYVAVTRAKHILDGESCKAFQLVLA